MGILLEKIEGIPLLKDFSTQTCQKSLVNSISSFYDYAEKKFWSQSYKTQFSLKKLTNYFIFKLNY